MNEIIKNELLSILNQLGWHDSATVSVSKTKNPEHGDFSCNIAMLLAKPLKQAPMKIARTIQAKVAHPDITRVEVASPGFLNFFTSRDFSALITTIVEKNDAFFAPNVGNNRSIYLEYVSANPTGPLHVGHGRSAAYGSSLANVLRKTHHQVHTEYYINDAGLQIHILTSSMWLALLGVTVPMGCYTGQYLVDSVPSAPSVSLDKPEALTKLLDNWNPETDIETLITLAKESLGNDYHTLKNWVVEHITTQIQQDLTAFNVTYDNWFKESGLLENDMITQVVDFLSEKQYTYEKDGALWFKSSEHGDEKDRVLKRTNGIWTYFATDLAYHYHKCQSNATDLIDIFGADHHGYVPRILAGIKAFNTDQKNFECILIQFAHLYRGQEKLQMSTRSGQFVTLKELYDEVGVDAARFFYCMRRSDQHLDFDLELAKSQNNQNPVYYIQYAHARIKSIFKKHGQYIPAVAHWKQASDTEIEILELLSIYPEILTRVSNNKEVYRLAQYLHNLATHFHKYYNSSPVLSEDIDLRYHRLLLCHLIMTCLAEGLDLLGIHAPESM